jgi:hypothetical protein
MATHDELHGFLSLSIKQMNRGSFLAELHRQSVRAQVGSRRDRKLLVRPAVSDRRQLFTIFHNALRAAHAGRWWSAFHRFPRGIRLFAELNCVTVAAIRPRQRPYDAALTHRLPKQCRNIGSGAGATQRAVHHCAVNVKGVPAKPQYPLRGSDAGGSFVSHRHIMQPAPWHRKKCPLIW